MGALVNGTTIASLLSFIVLIVLLRIVGWNRIVDIMVQRQRRIEGALEDAARARQEAEALRARLEDELTGARKEAQRLLERAEKTAAERAQELLATARQAAERLQAQAAEEIRAERDEALRSIRAEVADLSLRIAERVLMAELDEKKSRDLVERALGEVLDAS
jgi:F-type H+-transporting ATPase subunit b